jgi:hypothetical protein
VDVALEEQKQELKSRLPPIDRRKMSELEIEFRELLEGILYTSKEIEAVTNPRLRAIYTGVAASYYEPAVYRAFEVLYVDYRPLRVAGRIVYRKLKEGMEESKVYRQSQIEAVLATTGMSLEAAESSWFAFIRLAKDKEIPVEKVESLIDGRALELLESCNKEEVLSALNTDGKKTLEFEEIVQRLNACTDVSPGQLLQKLTNFESSETLELSGVDRRRVKYNQRYDDMIVKFGEWKAFIPDGEGRRLDILRGCFVGSENPKVVDALRVIYTDYTALRLSGDWIYKVVSTIMGATQRRQIQ